jgi:NAD(P)-dependent dehydrogenase (short-subunit alcohol dehydrogenase family)
MRKQNRGQLVAISSGTGLRGHPRLASYSAAKFGVQGLLQSAAQELEGSDIRSFLVNPGGVATRMLSDLFGEEEARKHQPPEAVARIVTEVLSGGIYVPNGGGICIRGCTVTDTYEIPSKSA